MKFKIEIWKNFDDGTRPQYVTGFLTLEDAIDSAYAIARRRTAGAVNVCVAGKRRHYDSLSSSLTGFYPKNGPLENPARNLENARAALVKVKAKIKAERGRDKFVRAHGGWGSGLIDRIVRHDGMKAAFFGGDFAALEKMLAELPVPGNSEGKTP